MKPKGRKSGTQNIQVTLEYNADGHQITGDGLTQGIMFQEIVTMRNLIPDWSPERWSEFMHKVGHLPVWVVWKSVDVWHMLIYAGEVLRQHPESQDAGRCELQRMFHETHPNFDVNKLQPEIDGKVWGGVPMDDPQYLSFKQKPIREQMEQKEQAHIVENLERSKPTPHQVEKTKEAQDEAWLAKWKEAERLAKSPLHEWQGQADPELEVMAKYCYSWLGDLDNAPISQEDRVELFRPVFPNLPMDDPTVKRRHYITGKVLKFWQKSLAQKDGALLVSNPLSYRVVLAAQKLAKAIEKFAVNTKEADDKTLGDKVKKRAVEYYNAHLPVEKVGGNPGPISTQDPDYVEYLRLCRQYQIPEGTLLHDLDI